MPTVTLGRWVRWGRLWVLLLTYRGSLLKKMSFHLMSTMEKRPWETFHSLETNLFGLCNVQSSWEDLSTIKPGKGPTLPRITMHSRISLRKFPHSHWNQIQYLLISNQNKGPVSIAKLARFLQICSEVNEIASK